MEQSELLHHVVTALEKLRLRYLVTGSTATIYFGEPRFTNDIDVVVALPPERVAAFCREFPSPTFYLSEEAAREAATHFGQFNIIHPTSGLKVDVIIPQDTPFNRNRFARAKRLRPAEDYDASFASAEDVIIKKKNYGGGIFGGIESVVRARGCGFRQMGHRICLRAGAPSRLAGRRAVG